MSRRLILIVLGLSLAIMPMVLAATDEASIEINISIESVTQITINPISLNWTTINPGSAGGVKEIDIINIGSTNVTAIYAYVDTISDETLNPIGNDTAQAYGAGGVLTLRRNETDALHYFAGRTNIHVCPSANKQECLLGKGIELRRRESGCHFEEGEA